jgi:hypothetical protein
LLQANRDESAPGNASEPRLAPAEKPLLLPELVVGLAEYRLLAFGVLMFAVLRLAPLGIVGALERPYPAEHG